MPGVVERTSTALWAPFVDLCHLVDDVILNKNSSRLAELDNVLRKYKPNFISLLKHPLKSESDRAKLRKAPVEGVELDGDSSSKCVLSEEFVEEAIILSDLFNLNEFSALQLLLSGEREQDMYPGLSRALTAVLLYYDGRRSLVAALKTLVQARRGVTWNCQLPDGVIDLVTKYIDSVLEENMVNKVLELVSSLDWEQEVKKLNDASALADRRHLRQLRQLFLQTRQCLADVLACWACQTPLSQQDTLRLIDHLSSMEPAGANGRLDSVQLSLLMAVVHSISPLRMLRLLDAAELADRWPLLCEDGFAVSVHKLMTEPRQWKCPQLLHILQLAWSAALLALRSLSSSFIDPIFSGIMEDDEAVLDVAIKEDVFLHLREKVIASESFFKEEFYVRFVHEAVTMMLISLPLKVKELRNRADETARAIQMHQQEGLDPPANLPRDFEHLLQMMTALYTEDPLKLGLAQEYCVTDSGSHRQMTLYKFLRTAGELLPAVLFVPYLNLLSALCNCEGGAQQCYSLLTSPAHSGLLSLSRLFSALQTYHASLSQQGWSPMVTAGAGVPPSALHARPPSKQLSSNELSVMLASLRLIRAIAEGDAGCRLLMCEKSAWSPLPVMISLLCLHVPAALKAQLLVTLEAFARSAEVATLLWHELESAQLLQTRRTTLPPRGIQMELEEVEVRAEHFPQTRAFIRLVTTLVRGTATVSLAADSSPPGLLPYLNFVIYEVLLNFNSRAYRNPSEKFEIGGDCVEFLLTLVEMWDGDVSSVGVERADGEASVRMPGQSVLLLMMHESKLLKLVIHVLEDCAVVLDMFSEFDGFSSLSRLSLLTLRLLNACLQRQKEFLAAYRHQADTSLLPPVSGLDLQLLASQDQSTSAHFPLTVVKYLGYGAWLCEHVAEAAALLQRLCVRLPVQQQLTAVFTASPTTLRHTMAAFVECLDVRLNEDDTVPGHRARVSVLQLLLAGLSLPGPTVAHLLLGFASSATAKVRDHPADVLSNPLTLSRSGGRTCLHALLSLLSDGLSAITPPSVCHTCPNIADMAYQVLYQLCASPLTSGESLRYLRSSCDFIYCQLQPLPRLQLHSVAPAQPLFLRHCTWLMKIATVELKTTWCSQLHSQLSRLTNLLVYDGSASVVTPLVGSLSLSQAMGGSVSINSGGNNQQRKLIALLNAVDYAKSSVDQPNWQYFDPGQIEKAVCQCQSSSGARLVDVAKLHSLLMTELATLHSTTAVSQRQHIVHEIKSVLVYCVRRNEYAEWLYRTSDYLHALRQLLEMVVTVVPPGQLSQSPEQLIVDISRQLLNKMLDSASVTELTAPLAGTLLLLMTWLSANPGSASAWSLGGQLALRGLFDCVQLRWKSSGAGCSHQRSRASLYGSLLQLLQPAAADSDQWRHLAAVCAQYGSDRLLETVCRDSTSGHHICRILAMCTVSALLAVDHTLVAQLVASGFVADLCQTVVTDAEQLHTALSSSSVSAQFLQVLFVYEARLAVACRIASSGGGSGARALLRSRVVPRLAPPQQQWSAPLEEPHRGRLLAPVLRLCVAVLTAVSGLDRSATDQVLLFLSSHIETVTSLLRYQPTQDDPEILQLTSLLTAVLCQLSSSQEGVGVSAVSLSTDEIAQLCARLQHLAVSQLSSFLQWLTTAPDSHPVQELRQDNLRLQVLCQLLDYYYCSECSLLSPALPLFQQLVAAARGSWRLLEPVLSRQLEVGQQLDHVQTLDSALLVKLADEQPGHVVSNISQLQAAASDKLKQIQKLLKHKVYMLRHILEASLLCVWLHLRQTSSAGGSSRRTTAASDSSSLRQQMCAQLTDSLLDDLQHTLQKSSDGAEQDSFGEVMIRRIRRLALLDNPVV